MLEVLRPKLTATAPDSICSFVVSKYVAVILDPAVHPTGSVSQINTALLREYTCSSTDADREAEL